MDSEKWKIKGFDIEELYKTVSKNSKAVSKGSVALESLVWPGATTIAYGSKTSNIYVGYGHKYQQKYYPFDPETVLTEKEDRNEFVVPEWW